MRLLDAIGWLGIAAIIASAVVVASVLGFLGVFLIGGLGWLVCTLAALNQDVPTWGRDAFAARMQREDAPERRAGSDAERLLTLQPLRYFGRCGMALAVIGAAGFVWQLWSAAHPA